MQMVLGTVMTHAKSEGTEGRLMQTPSARRTQHKTHVLLFLEENVNLGCRDVQAFGPINGP